MRLSRLILRAANDVTVVDRDILRLSLKAGKGGQGIARYNGLGGNGGSIFLVPKNGFSFTQMLDRFRKRGLVKAENGESSSPIKLVGAHASDKFVEVPLGVECVNQENHMLLSRCTKPGKKYIVASGGRGGCAETGYKGEHGESLLVSIHLKLQPNVGLVGFPNAGKSTLLKALVPEKNIKIASYPFTTLKPQVCHVRYAPEKSLPSDPSTDDEENVVPEKPFSLTVADLPGIIEGASRNRGRGYAFLKHLEHSDIVLMVVDVHGFQLSARLDEPFRSAEETVALLNGEMETYDISLVHKPTILVLNKTDVSDGEAKADVLRKLFEDPAWAEKVPKELRPRYPIAFEGIVSTSARKRQLGNLKELLRKVHERIHPITHLDKEVLEEDDNKMLM